MMETDQDTQNKRLGLSGWAQIAEIIGAVAIVDSLICHFWRSAMRPGLNCTGRNGRNTSPWSSGPSLIRWKTRTRAE